MARHSFHQVPLQRTVPQAVEASFVVDHGHVSLLQVQTIRRTVNRVQGPRFISRKTSRILLGKPTLKNYPYVQSNFSFACQQ